MNTAPREHWENVYRTKDSSEVSWYQPVARVSLELIKLASLRLDAPIIDVGGGASTLVDGLLDLGYGDITVLDVAGESLATAQKRLGSRSALVKWIESDVLDARFSKRAYAVWHDRAVFHFLTDARDRGKYRAQILAAVEPHGHAIVGTFAPDAPPRCSGLDVVRYSVESLQAEFGKAFTLIESVREVHETPSGVKQPFIYCLFRLNDYADAEPDSPAINLFASG